MDNKTAHTLVKLNNAFYAHVHDSFSQTRQSPWNGWKRLTEEIPTHFWNRTLISLLDLACGNGRFEQFLARSYPETIFDAKCIDSCDELFDTSALPQKTLLQLSFHHWDILNDIDEIPSNLPTVDLSACFGFFHHIPLQKWRERVLAYLASQTRPGGYIAISFWSFMNDPSFAQKANHTHQQALQWFTQNKNSLSLDQQIDATQLQANDFFLGWQHADGVYRYCHSYTSEEIDELLATLPPSVSVVSRYFADGKNNNLNEYVILHVK